MLDRSKKSNKYIEQKNRRLLTSTKKKKAHQTSIYISQDLSLKQMKTL